MTEDDWRPIADDWERRPTAPRSEDDDWERGFGGRSPQAWRSKVRKLPAPTKMLLALGSVLAVGCLAVFMIPRLVGSVPFLQRSHSVTREAMCRDTMSLTAELGYSLFINTQALDIVDDHAHDVLHQTTDDPLLDQASHNLANYVLQMTDAVRSGVAFGPISGGISDSVKQLDTLSRGASTASQAISEIENRCAPSQQRLPGK